MCVCWEWQLQFSGHDISHAGGFDCAFALHNASDHKGVFSHLLIKTMTPSFSQPSVVDPH